MAYFGFSFCCGFGLAVFLTSFAIWLECEAELDVALKRPAWSCAPARSRHRLVELEEPKFSKSTGESRLVVEHMVAAVVVVLAPAVVCAVARVPRCPRSAAIVAGFFRLTCSKNRGSTVRQ